MSNCNFCTKNADCPGLNFCVHKAEEGRFFPFEFEIWQGDEMVASVSGPREDALNEARHYAWQYGQDGERRIFEVTRKLIE